MDDNERLSAMEPRLRLKRSLPQAGLELGLLDHQASAKPTELPDSRPRGYKTFFMLNSVEREILNAHKISRKLAYIRLK